MFTHLLQIASFQSKPQNFKSPVWVIILFSLCFIAVQGYALSMSPGNDLMRMMAASFIKIVAIGAILIMWIKSLQQGEHYASTFLVVIVTSFLAELVKFPLSTMIRETEANADVMMAVLYSLPLWGMIVWQYAVWYYVFKEVSQRAKGEIVTVMIVIVMVSEVAGSVLSQIGAPVEGFS